MRMPKLQNRLNGISPNPGSPYREISPTIGLNPPARSPIVRRQYVTPTRWQNPFKRDMFPLKIPCLTWYGALITKSRDEDD